MNLTKKLLSNDINSDFQIWITNIYTSLSHEIIILENKQIKFSVECTATLALINYMGKYGY